MIEVLVTLYLFRFCTSIFPSEYFLVSSVPLFHPTFHLHSRSFPRFQTVPVSPAPSLRRPDPLAPGDRLTSRPALNHLWLVRLALGPRLKTRNTTGSACVNRRRITSFGFATFGGPISGIMVSQQWGLGLMEMRVCKSTFNFRLVTIYPRDHKKLRPPNSNQLLVSISLTYFQ